MRDRPVEYPQHCSLAMALAMALVWSCGAGATELVVPLRVPYPEVTRAASRALDMDADGRVTIERNECNVARLSDLRLQPEPPDVEVSVAFDADLGTRLFDRCIGPKNARGRLHVRLEPRVADDERALVLAFRSAELRRPDGRAGLLTRPARILAERVVLPRLEQVRIDLTRPLRSVDRLIETFADADTPLLSERSRLIAVELGVDGTEARIALDVSPPTTADDGPEPALDDAEWARWQTVEDELDGFLTAAIVDLAETTRDRDLQLDLLAVLLDARLQIAAALTDDPTAEWLDTGAPEPDPIRELFIDTWDQLRPLVLSVYQEGEGGRLGGLRLAAFMAGADAIAALDALGPEYNIEISRNGIRRLARLLLEGDAPGRFTPLPRTIDPDLRRLFGAADPAPDPSARRHWLDWWLPAAHAEEAAFYPTDWQQFVPRAGVLEDALSQVSALLHQVTDDHLAKTTRIPDPVRPIFLPLVLATAWKESCWRHYISDDMPPTVIRSSIGAVGMMQINGRVWRGIYDLDRLEREIDYNAAAGAEILEHYLIDYAMRRGEHELPGGLDNLPRATYAAYNGGPRHLSRYRKTDTPARLQAIDRLFWKHFERTRSEGRPRVGSCYAGG